MEKLFLNCVSALFSLEWYGTGQYGSVLCSKSNAMWTLTSHSRHKRYHSYLKQTFQNVALPLIKEESKCSSGADKHLFKHVLCWNMIVYQVDYFSFAWVSISYHSVNRPHVGKWSTRTKPKATLYRSSGNMGIAVKVWHFETSKYHGNTYGHVYNRSRKPWGFDLYLSTQDKMSAGSWH